MREEGKVREENEEKVIKKMKKKKNESSKIWFDSLPV